MRDIGFYDYNNFCRMKYQDEIRDIQDEMNRRDTFCGVIGLKEDNTAIKTAFLFTTYIISGILSLGIIFIYDFRHFATYDAAEIEFKRDAWKVLVFDEVFRTPVGIALRLGALVGTVALGYFAYKTVPVIMEKFVSESA